MKNKLSSALVGLLSVTLIASCSRETPKVYGVPPGEQKLTKGSAEELPAIVDILFIIDDSGSMASHQSNLRNNVSLFVGELGKNKKIDYQIGVITTDNSSTIRGGRLVGNPKIITPTTPNGLLKLMDNLMVGTYGSGTEEVFDPAVRALSEHANGANKGFLRPEAYLAIVVLTDAEDQSDRYNANQFYQFLLGLKKNDVKRIITYGAIIPSGSNSSICYRDGYEEPVRLEEFFTITRGLSFFLCDPAFGTQIANIGKDLVKKVVLKVLLDRLPVLSSIKVTYGTQVIPASIEDGWIYLPEENAITFGPNIVWSEQPDGTSVEVDYTSVDR